MAAGLVGLVGLFVQYLVLVNALLLSGVGKVAINHISPEHIHVQWRSAYSPWFMRVYTTGFAIRGEDASAQWAVTTDRANGSFGPFDFFSRRVRLHDVWARGVTTHLRFKLDPSAATADYTAKLPKIAGFADPPLKPAIPPVTDVKRMWGIEIDDAAIDDVREVWVDNIRVTDTGGHVTGGFSLLPIHRLFVRPTECQTEDASVFDGKNTITSELHGSFELGITDVDLSAVHGSEILQHLDGTAKARAKVGDLLFLDPWLHSAHIALSGGVGPTVFALEVHQGELVSGSHAWMRAEGWSLWSDHNGLFAASSLVTATVTAGKPHLAITAETLGLDVHRDKTQIAHAPTLLASALIDNVDMTKPFDRWAVSLDVPLATAKDLKALNAYLDEPMLQAGSGTLKGHANISPHTLSGHANVHVSNAKVMVGKALVTANGTAQATLRDFDLRSGKGDLAGAQVELRDVSAADQNAWWADFSANPLSIALEHGFSVSGSITGKFRNAQVPLAILDAPGIVQTVFGSQGFTVSTRVRYSQETTELSDLRMIGNTVEVRAHYRGSDGAALVETPLINVGVLIRKGDATTHLFVTRDWYSRTLGTRPPIDAL